MDMIGKRVRIDLTNQEWSERSIPFQTILKWAGGTGLALEVFTGESVFHDGGGVVFAPGLMAGTNAPAANWCSAVYHDLWKKEPKVSYFGGHWGAGLKMAGVQVLEIVGHAPFLSLLVVEKEGVRFLNIKDLAGLNTSETQRRLEALLGEDYRIACIGPAGERGLPFSSLVFEGGYQRNSAGLGAVLGRMGIKAIAVKGNDKITPASAQDFYNEARRLLGCFAEQTFPFRALSTQGSSHFLKKVQEEALLPIQNFNTSIFDRVDAFSRELLPDFGGRRPIACSGCPIGCRLRAKTGNAWGEAPGYEEIVALGTLCGIEDPTVVFQIKAYCDSLGLDPITIGGVLACLMDAAEGPGKESLHFGEGQKILEMMSSDDPVEVFGRMGVGKDEESEPACLGSKWVGFICTDPRADAYLALNRFTWPLSQPYLLGSRIFSPLLPIYRELGEGLLDVASAVAAYQDFSLGLECLGFCPWSALCFGSGDLDRLIEAAVGDHVSSKMTTCLGRNVVMDFGPMNFSGVELESQYVSRFRKLARKAIADGPHAGQKLDLGLIIKKYIDVRNKQRERYE